MMLWNADIFLAFRFLRPRRNFISVLTLLSILGPVLGVALLVIVTAVMSGFDRDIRTRILDMQAHLQVWPIPDPSAEIPVIRNPERVLSELRRFGVAGAPLIEGPVLLQTRTNRVVIRYLRGIDPGREKAVSGIARSMVRGRFDIHEGEALIGEEMAAELGLTIGDRILVHSPARLTRNLRWRKDGRIEVRDPESVYLPEELTVAGVFSLGVYEYDRSIVFVHIDQAAELFGFDWGTATSIQARVPDPFHMTKLEQTLREALPHYRIVSWQEANRQLFGALRVEKNLMSFLLFFIIIVAAFGISGTLITAVVQKTREIGIMKAVGMSGGMIARIFLFQGAVIGALGTSLGLAAGLLVIHYRDGIARLLSTIMGVEVFPKELYHLTRIPAAVTPSDLARIVIAALALCILGALIPALYASRLPPAQALRDEA